MTDAFQGKEFHTETTFYVDLLTDPERALWCPHSSHSSRTSAGQQAAELAQEGHRVRVVMTVTNSLTLYEIDGKFNKLIKEMEVNAP